MARVYSSSRLMLDPNFILSARRAADEREAAARDVRKDISRGIGEIGASIGGAVDYALERKARNERREMMENAPDIADPEYKAAVERFVETGDISGLNAYRSLKENRERMAKEAEARERELAIRKQEADAMAKKTVLLDIEGAGGDISKYRLPTEKEETIADETAEVETEGYKKSIKGQINDLTIRYNNGFKTKAERAAFISDIDEMRKTAKGSELDELTSLRDKAAKYITDEEKAESKEKSKQEKANLYKAKSQNPAEFFVWFNKLNDKEKEAYEKAYKDIFGGE